MTFFFIFCKRGLPNIELIVGLEEETTETNGYYVSIFLRFTKLLLLQERLRLDFFFNNLESGELSINCAFILNYNKNVPFL